MSQPPSPTDSELLEDSPKDLTQLVDSDRASQFYSTVFNSSQSSEMEDDFGDQISQFQRANSQQYDWTDDEIKCLNENQEYFAKMLEAVAQAKITGPQKLPPKPKRKLDDLFREKKGGKKTKKQLSSADLHAYLHNNLVDINEKANRVFFSKLDPSFEKLKEQLIYGYQQIKRQNAQTVLFYMQYGKMLNVSFRVFETEKKEGKHSLKWNEFLTQTIGISESYARKLRNLALDLDPQTYPQFLRLGLSFSEIMSLKKDIIKMLNEEQFSTFWKTPVEVPNVQQESQETSS